MRGDLSSDGKPKEHSDSAECKTYIGPASKVSLAERRASISNARPRLELITRWDTIIPPPKKSSGVFFVTARENCALGGVYAFGLKIFDYKLSRL